MNKNLARVLDIELNVSVILGRTKMALKDIFELGKGSNICKWKKNRIWSNSCNRPKLRS